MHPKIEILPISLLDQHRALVNELKKLARSLGLEFGWHYLLDLTWVLSQLGEVSGKRILDAGAGTGIIQWHLANKGAEVISVDRVSRAALPLKFRTRFNVRGWRTSDLAPVSQTIRQNFLQSTGFRAKIKSQIKEVRALTNRQHSPGRVWIYNQGLSSLTDINSDSVDAVVAISALEHNHPEDLGHVVQELVRVLKPGGVLLATLAAAQGTDWLHEPSHGWCYTEASLRRLFNLPPDTSSNYHLFGELFTTLINCAELRDGLAKFYFHSDNNGMPWGKWDPKYPPVGIRKIKLMRTSI